MGKYIFNVHFFCLGGRSGWGERLSSAVNCKSIAYLRSREYEKKTVSKDGLKELRRKWLHKSCVENMNSFGAVRID